MLRKRYHQQSNIIGNKENVDLNTFIGPDFGPGDMIIERNDETGFSTRRDFLCARDVPSRVPASLLKCPKSGPYQMLYLSKEKKNISKISSRNSFLKGLQHRSSHCTRFSLPLGSRFVPFLLVLIIRDNELSIGGGLEIICCFTLGGLCRVGGFKENEEELVGRKENNVSDTLYPYSS